MGPEGRESERVGGAFGLSEGFIDGFCDQWLNRRLICIGSDRCAVGKVAHIEYVKGKGGFEWLFDNDTSANLRMSPYTLKEFPWEGGPDHDWQAMVADGYPGADLVRKRFPDLSYKGYGAGDDKPPGPHPGGRWSLHCEFEGDGMVTLCAIGRWLAIATTLTAPVWIAVGALFGAGYVGWEAAKSTWNSCKKSCSVPILCDAWCFFEAVVAGVAGAVAGAVAGGLGGPGLAAVILGGIASDIFGMRHDGAFADAANDPASGTIEEEDCVFMAGDHVYDAGHPEGWHELHPVKHLQKICAHPMPPPTPDPNAADDPCATADDKCCPETRTKCTQRFGTQADHDKVQLFWDRWCKGYQTSIDPLVVAAQEMPENQWCIHPLVDGCGRSPETTPTGSGSGEPQVH